MERKTQRDSLWKPSLSRPSSLVAILALCLLTIVWYLLIVNTDVSMSLQAAIFQVNVSDNDMTSAFNKFGPSSHSPNDSVHYRTDSADTNTSDRFHDDDDINAWPANATLANGLDIQLNLSDYRRRLRARGLEPTFLHEFKSPYIVDPIIYDDDDDDDDHIVIPKAPGDRRTTKIISCYNCPKWFINQRLSLKNRDFKRCPYSECLFDAKGTRRSEADLVLFFPTPSLMPPRPVGQIWAYCSWESASNYGYPSPYSKWKSAFNWTISYRQNANLFFPNNRMAWKAEETLLPDSEYERAARRKSKTAAWFVSNCHTASKRQNYVREMKNYIDVDIFGKCGSGICDPSVCLKQLNDTYKFYLGFENSICEDYVTEKLFRNFDGRLHVVPVVRGGFDYDKYLPPNTVVNAANFQSAKELALYLKDLGEDLQRYATMLKEKDKLTVLNYKHDWCQACEKLHKGVPRSTIADIREYSTKGVCHH